MRDGDILVLSGHEAASLLDGREAEIIHTVRRAYEAHAHGESSLPHSTFLRFPGEQGNRIISLPAYLGDDFKVAGIKWVASFPNNLQLGLNRASAVIVLNSILTGRPEAIIEGSVISAKRTAASAALAAQHLQEGEGAECLGVVGCGLISFEIVRFVTAACPGVTSLAVFDIDAQRARQFKKNCRRAFPSLEVEVAEGVEAVFRRTTLVSLATTAATPHISDLSACAPRSTILHISLRDLTPEVILSCDNVVDDVDHVCRAQTSVHLAEQLVGHRGFITATLVEIVNGTARRRPDAPAVFSPFGLGVLDLAVARLVCEWGAQQNLGTVLRSFLPGAWTDAP